MKEQLSNCCKAPVIVDSADEGTSCYVCAECKKPCDLLQHEDIVFKLAEDPVYVCAKHGETTHYITSSFEGFTDKYCQICYMEMIEKYCCKLEVKK